MVVICQPYEHCSSRSINLNFAIFLLNVDLGYRQVEHRLCWRIPRYLRNQRRRWGARGEPGDSAMSGIYAAIELFFIRGLILPMYEWQCWAKFNHDRTTFDETCTWQRWDPNKYTSSFVYVSHVVFAFIYNSFLVARGAYLPPTRAATPERPGGTMGSPKFWLHI